MPRATWRLFLFACIVLTCLSQAFGQEKSNPNDWSVVELDKAKALYEQELKALGQDLLNKLDAEQDKENAKAPSERDLPATKRRIEILAKDREALLERGEWPTSISIAEIRYHWGSDHRSKLRDAYHNAQARAAQQGDEGLKKQLAEELIRFDKTNDLAPWQNLSPKADVGQGEAAWNRVGEIFTCPPKGKVGGAKNPLRFRRAMPAEYALRFNVKWIEGDGALVLGLVDSRGQQFELPIARPVPAHGATSSIATEDVAHVAVDVRKDHLSLALDGREVRSWTEGQDFPAEREPPGAKGPELFIASNDADTRLKVLSAEIKCLSWSNTAPSAPESRAKTPPAPTTKAERHEKSAVQTSMLSGLDWLIRHQDKDGGWKLESYTSVCPSELPCIAPGHKYTQDYDPGVTGLATFALARAREQLSKAVIKEAVDWERIDAAARAGLSWLASRQKPDGSFSKGKSFVYNETLATLALASAYGFTKKSELREPAQRAVDFIQRAQRPSPNLRDGLWGWRYASRMEVEDPSKSADDDNYKKALHDSDVSATGWAVMALSCARTAGLEVKQESLEGAFEFAKFVTADNGLVGYIHPSSAGQIITGPNDQYVYHAAGMSALGTCIRIFTHHDANDPFIDLAARRIVTDSPLATRDKLSVDYYYWYCGTVALDQLDGPDSLSKGGKYWNPWDKALVEALLPLQDKNEQACSSGAWLVPDRWSFTGGPIYATAINVLTLEDALGWK